MFCFGIVKIITVWDFIIELFKFFLLIRSSVSDQCQFCQAYQRRSNSFIQLVVYSLVWISFHLMNCIETFGRCSRVSLIDNNIAIWLMTFLSIKLQDLCDIGHYPVINQLHKEPASDCESIKNICSSLQLNFSGASHIKP